MESTLSTSTLPQTPNHASPAPRRLDYLDGLRALAAICVMLTHACAIVYPRHAPEVISLLMSLARPSVDLFITLSGFCLMLPVLKAGKLSGGAGQFYKRRARRILPPYYFAIGLSLLLAFTIIGKPTGSYWDTGLPITTKGVLAHLLMLQSVYAGAQIDGPTWSVAVEWWIYFLFPALLVLSARFGHLRTTAAILTSSVLVWLAIGHTRLAGSTPQYVGLFAMGTLAAVIAYGNDRQWSRVRSQRVWAWIAAILTPAPFAAAYVLGKLFVERQIGWLDLILGLWGFSLLIAVSQPESRLRPLVSWKPLAFVGTFSYSLYLLHYPLEQVFWQYLSRPLGLGKTMTLAVDASVGSVAIVAASYVFFLFCERPFMNSRAPGVWRLAPSTTASAVAATELTGSSST